MGRLRGHNLNGAIQRSQRCYKGKLGVEVMKQNVNTLERAFELARTGEFDRIGQIQVRLKREGYSSELIFGRYLSAQLRELMRMARPGSYGLPSEHAGGAIARAR